LNGVNAAITVPQPGRHRLKEDEPKSLVLAGGDIHVRQLENPELLALAHRPQKEDALAEVGRPDRFPQAGLLGPAADDQEPHLPPPQPRHQCDELGDRFTSNETPDGDEDDVVLGQPVRLAGADLEERPRDGQRDTQGWDVGVEPAHVLQGVGRLPDDEVGSSQQVSDPGSEQRVPVG
jgi:hypothetical protein